MQIKIDAELVYWYIEQSENGKVHLSVRFKAEKTKHTAEYEHKFSFDFNTPDEALTKLKELQKQDQ